MTQLIIHDRKFKDGVNFGSKIENRADIGSKLVKRIPTLVIWLIIYLKLYRFVTLFDHRKIAVS